MRRKSDFELVETQGGKYALVVGVTQRASQLTDGARPLVERTVLNAVATAIDELAQGRTKIVAPKLPARPSPLRTIPPEVLDPAAVSSAPAEATDEGDVDES